MSKASATKQAIADVKSGEGAPNMNKWNSADRETYNAIRTAEEKKREQNG